MPPPTKTTSPQRAVAEKPFPYADEPFGVYYAYQNPGAADRPLDGYSKWKYATSRKQIAVDTWTKREQARTAYERRHGTNPHRWPQPHPTTVVWPTNAPEVVCLRCLWIDGTHWDARAAETAAALHTATAPAADPSRPEEHARAFLTAPEWTLLTGLNLDGSQLLAIPVSAALADLTTSAVFRHAPTFGEARSDPGAAQRIEQGLPAYLARLAAEGDADAGIESLRDVQSDDAAPFDASVFFGPDEDWWRPDPQRSTATWLKSQPLLATRYAHPATSTRQDSQPVPRIDTVDRVSLEDDARTVGYTVIAAPGLAEAYRQDPGYDVFATLLAVVNPTGAQR